MGVLEAKKIAIKEEVNASKNTINGDAVWDFVKNAEKVVVTSGKKILEFSPENDKEEMMQKIKGKTGNLRAPAVRVGNTLYIGYNDQLYSERIT